MFCTFSSSCSINVENILYFFAQQSSIDSNRWTEEFKLDTTLFAGEEVKHLQQNQVNGMSKGSFLNMLEAFKLGLPRDSNQYQVENTLGFIGKYQFGEPLLISLGYYKAAIYYGHGADKNHWRGTWTGKKGIDSKSKFLNSPDVQEFAIREAFALNWSRISDRLGGQGKSIDDYLGQSKTFSDCGVSKTVTITLSGILAAAHLRGPYGVADLLLKNRSAHDEFSTSILRYMNEYGGYDATPADFINSDS